MKIIEFADFYNNKTGNPLSIISEGMKKKGIDIKVFTSNIEIKPEKMTQEDDKKSIVKIKRFKGINFFTKAIYPGCIPALLIEDKKTIVHSHVAGFFSSFISAVIKPLKGFKLIINSDYDTNAPQERFPKSMYTDFFLGFPLRSADKIICWTKKEAETLIKKFRANPEKIKVIPIGYFEEKLCDGKSGQIRKIHGLEKKFLVLNTNILVRKKNIEMILNAIAQTEDKEITLLHAGGIMDKNYKKELDEIIKNKNLGSQAIFLGKKSLDEIYSIYPQADLFVNSGFRESFGIPIIEAMASGIPVITTNTGIAPEVIIEGQTGFYAENEKELAKKIIELKKNKELRERTAKKAKEEVKKFEWKKILGEYEKLFEEIQKGDEN